MNKITPGSQGLNFDKGIESITYTRDQADMSLPERSLSAPPDSEIRAQLSLLLERQTLDDAISSSLRPTMVDRDLLVPVKFGQALTGALDRIKNAAAQRADGGEGSEEQLRVLNRASRLLADEVSLRDLVTMYRSALYQG